MARTLTFVPSQTAPTGSKQIGLDSIPEEVKQEVEDTYKVLKDNPSGRMRVTFDSRTELLQYTAQVTSYCAQRPAEIGGPLRFRKSPTKGLDKNTVMDFRITDPVDNGTEAINEAVAEVKAEAAATPEAKKATPRKK